MKNNLAELVKKYNLPIVFFLDKNIDLKTRDNKKYYAFDNYIAEIDEVIKIGGKWRTKDDHTDILYNTLEYDPRYFSLTSDEYCDVINGTIERANFTKAICVYLILQEGEK